jgi:hypothetical protein
MKKYMSIVVFAMIAMTTNLYAQDAPKQKCCSMSQSSCKMDSEKCKMATKGNKTDGMNMADNKDMMKKCMNMVSAKCDSTMCNNNSANCKQLKNCPMRK